METVYPVLFTLNEVVSGNGFVAGVHVQGRGSMVLEGDEGWWLYGMASLPKWKAEGGYKVVVQRLDKAKTRPTPKNNKPNILALPIAA